MKRRLQYWWQSAVLESAEDPQNAKLYTTIAGPAGSYGTVNCRRFSLTNAGESRDVVLYMLGKPETVYLLRLASLDAFHSLAS